MQISPADRSIAIVVKADGAGATASQSSANAAAAKLAAASSEPIRAGVTQPRGTGGDYLDATQGAKGPDSPSADATRQDWTSTPRVAEEKKEEKKEEVKPRLFELLIEQFNSLWRASAQAVADPSVQNQVLAQAKSQSQADGSSKNSPLVYTDPSKVRKASSTEGA